MIDYTALYEPISEAEVARYREQNTDAVGMIDGTGCFIVVLRALLVIGVVVAAIPLALAIGRPFPDVLPFLLFSAGISALLVGGILLARRFPITSPWVSWLRVNRFATANNFDFWIQGRLPAFPASAFAGISSGTTNYRLKSRTSSLELANYMTKRIGPEGDEIGAGAGGYIAIELDRSLPNIVLMANSSRFFSGVPRDYSDDQVLRLEGDFNEYFTLHCPRGYERDALYLFTPDLMALLIDKARGFDVEVVDNWMFVYSDLPMVRADAAWMSRLFAIIDLVGTKTLRQSDGYRDERVGTFAANVVSRRGSRLARTGRPRASKAQTIVLAIVSLPFLVSLAVFAVVFANVAMQR